MSAFASKVKVGSVTACEAYYQAAGGMVMQVNTIGVLPEYQRQRVGTSLYEHAAKNACERGLALVSSPEWARSRLATAFWAKQAAKGRVVDTGNRGVFKLLQTCGADLSRS